MRIISINNQHKKKKKKIAILTMLKKHCKIFKSKRVLHESYPISPEYFISFDEDFHRECIRIVFNNCRKLWV